MNLKLHTNNSNEHHENLIVVLIAIVSLSVTLSTGVNLLLLPEISLDLGNLTAEYGLILQSVLIVSLYLFFGKIGDMIGLVATCRYGSCILATGYFLCFLCSSEVGYLFSCAFIGIGTAMVCSVTGGIIRNTVSTSRAPRAFSVLFIGYAMGFLFSPLILEWIESFRTWHYYFLLLTPLPVILICFFGKVMDCSSKQIQIKDIDIPGAVLLMLTLIFTYIPLIQILKDQLRIEFVLLLICAGITGILLFWYEKRSKNPFIDLDILSRVDILVLIAIVMVVVMLYRSYLFYIQIYFEEIMRVLPVTIGLYQLIPGISFVPCAIFIGNMGKKWNVNRFFSICLIGCIMGIGAVLIHGIFHPLLPLIALFFFGAYNACIRIASYTQYFLVVSKEEAGFAGGLIETGIAFVNPLIIPVTGFFFHQGFHLYTSESICWQGLYQYFSWGNLGVSIFLLSGVLIQIILLMKIKKRFFVVSIG